MVKRYQDYAIKDGKFIGEFEEMYQNFEDPWLQSIDDHVFDSRRVTAKNWVKRIALQNNLSKACEIGCGFGYITKDLVNEGLDCFGVDISETAVNKARLLHPNCDFEVGDLLEFDVYAKHQTNVFLMTEITWYILPKLKEFIEGLKEYKRNTAEIRNQKNVPVYLIHLLTIYDSDTQKYGREYFTDLDGILAFFGLKYLEYGFVVGNKGYDANSRGTYFVAQL